MRRLLLAALLAAGLAGPVASPALAQDRAQSLADIKAELDLLLAQFTQLKDELVTTGAVSTGAAGGDALQRMDAIEAELTRLTARTEEIELQLKSVVSDGTNRIGDIEFRLCELTEGCDPANLPDTPVLGGGATGKEPAAPVEPVVVPDAAPQANPDGLAMNEQADFDRAKGVLDSGDFRTAADLFATFAQTYTGGQLTQAALVLRGDALDRMGDTANSARAYLEAFSGQPTGPYAGQALTKLGVQLGKLGQVSEACVTLGEVPKRFPGSADEAEARAAMASLGCS